MAKQFYNCTKDDFELILRESLVLFVILTFTGDYSDMSTDAVVRQLCASCSCCSKCAWECGGVCKEGRGEQEEREEQEEQEEREERDEVEISRTLQLLGKSEDTAVKSARHYVKIACKAEMAEYSSEESSESEDEDEDDDMVVESEEGLEDNDCDEEAVRMSIETLDVRDIELIE